MNLRNKRAISLIVLVITILVLSILAATVIISLSNTNVISEASDAVKKTEAQQLEEAKTLMLADGMLGNTPNDQTIGNTVISWDNENKAVVYKQLYGYPVKEGAVIPTDFYYVGGTKDTGVVISDDATDENKGVDYSCKGNQFVWVPVDDYSQFTRGKTVEQPEGSGIYKLLGIRGSDFTEPFSYNNATGYSSEVEEYDKMCASVEKYGGFYIARFEAGDGDVDEPRNKVTTAHTVVSKKNAYVYNYVPWGESMSSISLFTMNGVENVAGAVYLSQNMYKNSTSVVSTLCYGVQWDATVNFVSDAQHNIIDSRLWGNYSNSEGDAKTDSGFSNRDYTTGRNEAWKAKNIYDLAGNLQEWTMEAYHSDYRFARGGHMETEGDYFAVKDMQGGSATSANQITSFRVTLYLK